MMRSHTKRLLDAAIDEMKRDGFQCLLLLLDKKADDGGIEVLCSETNDPKAVQVMAQEALYGLANQNAGNPAALPN